VQKITVTQDEAGVRLDRFLAKTFSEHSRTYLSKLVEGDKVSINGVTENRCRRMVRPGDSIEIDFPPAQPSGVQPEDIPLEILFEDDWLAVIVKPAGITVHPGAGHKRGTLVNALVYRFSQLSQRDPARPGIVHRLDRDTSGLLVVAKSERAHHKLAGQFQRREVEKHYMTLVFGAGLDLHGKIEAPIGRHHSQRTRMAVSRTGREALTIYDVVEVFSEFTYLRVGLKTGRTHQIRVHLAHRGHPVVGDMVYGKGRLQNVRNEQIRARLQEVDRHFLHAAFLQFRHPKTAEMLRFESPLPPELEDLLTFVRAQE
jgi:23S rRNA pseudouridine1911/1915/1917 synthase